MPNKLAKSFYPVEIEQFGLLVGLEELARRTQEAFGISCAVQTDIDAPARLKDTRAIQFFRIAQEAVHNAAKHAQAKHIHICLTSQNGDCALSVKDDGVGLRREPRHAEGMGMRIMHYRARMIGGTLSVRNDDNGGVTVSCVAPPGPVAAKQTGKARAGKNLRHAKTKKTPDSGGG